MSDNTKFLTDIVKDTPTKIKYYTYKELNFRLSDGGVPDEGYIVYVDMDSQKTDSKKIRRV